MDMASTAMPKDIKQAMRWCQFIFSVNSVYASAIRRVISYFITDIVIESINGSDDDKSSVGDEEKEKYIQFLTDDLGIRTHLCNVALDFLVYGNSYTSVLLPFRRFLVCPTKMCGREVPLQEIYDNPRYNLTWKDYQWHAKCPKCGYKGPFRRNDRRSTESEQITIRRWSPFEIEIIHDDYTGNNKYIRRLPSMLKKEVQRGDLFTMSTMPWEVVEAVKHGQLFEFGKSQLYHMKEDGLAGILDRGYGISRVLTNFKQAWYCQILGRFNEAIALDYIVPFRVASPGTRSGASGESSDPLHSMHMGDFVAHGKRMVREHRQDPGSVHWFPFPVNYQTLGGEGSQMAPEALLQQATKSLLDGIGVPSELYSGTMTLQTAPASLRLFEANWAHLVHHLNKFLQNVVDRVAQAMYWEPVRCKLSRVKYADDLNRQMAQLQLMQAGLISKSTGLGSVGLNFAEEKRTSLEEDRLEAKLQQQAKDQMSQEELMTAMATPQDPAAQAGGGGVAGGPPPVAGGQPQPGAAASFAAGQPLLPNQPTTLEDLQGMAETLSQQALSMPSRAQRVSFMIQLRKENETLHSLVKSKIADQERRAALQGRDMVLQQQFGGGQA